MVHQERVLVATSGHGDMHDLTREVARIVAASCIRTGIAHVFGVGSTVAVAAIEFEPGLLQDLPQMLDRLMPPSRDYAHEQAWHDGNGHSHLQATTLGPTLTLPVAEGREATPPRALAAEGFTSPARGPVRTGAGHLATGLPP